MPTINTTLRSRTIALAGVFQAAKLVAQIAQTGQAEDTYCQASIGSIFDTEPVSTESIYGGLRGVQLGLTQLEFVIKNSLIQNKTEAFPIRYAISLLMLHKKLAKKPDILTAVTEKLPRIKAQLIHFHLLHDTILANLGDLYSSYVSQSSFRISIVGKQAYLEPQQQINKVRALLLAGIRSAVLWQQMGGRMYQLLFSKKSYARTAALLLDEIKRNP